MKLNDVFCNTFKAMRQEIGRDPRYSIDFVLPSMKMVNACRTDRFDFFLPFIDAGKLTEDQMQHACERYMLGKTKSGRPVYWMIDDMMQPLDAHVAEGWISTMLERREPILENWTVRHCLFGLHLLSVEDESAPIAIVEREEAAVILSELFPESIWMAYATTPHLSADLFAPLEGRIVTIYPRTDPNLSTLLYFEDLVSLTLRQYSLDLNVDTPLEDHASDDQKDRCIDILDYLLESLT